MFNGHLSFNSLMWHKVLHIISLWRETQVYLPIRWCNSTMITSNSCTFHSLYSFRGCVELVPLLSVFYICRIFYYICVCLVLKNSKRLIRDTLFNISQISQSADKSPPISIITFLMKQSSWIVTVLLRSNSLARSWGKRRKRSSDTHAHTSDDVWQKLCKLLFS